MNKMKVRAIRQHNRRILEQYRELTGNHHMSNKFRHGVKSWVEPNQSGRTVAKMEVS